MTHFPFLCLIIILSPTHCHTFHILFVRLYTILKKKIKPLLFTRTSSKCKDSIRGCAGLSSMYRLEDTGTVFVFALPVAFFWWEQWSGWLRPSFLLLHHHACLYSCVVLSRLAAMSAVCAAFTNVIKSLVLNCLHQLHFIMLSSSLLWLCSFSAQLIPLLFLFFLPLSFSFSPRRFLLVHGSPISLYIVQTGMWSKTDACFSFK